MSNRLLRRSRRRRGYALVIFALLFFCLMALAALVIDLCLARVTQRQMQTAVNSAAIEGLRGRDGISDDERRQNASDLVAWTFDDDFDLGSDQYQFGAGPRINFTGGLAIGSNFNASELMSLPDPPVYDPVLQTNADDEPDGDMVAGTYDETASDHQEQPDYSRADFTPAPGGAPPEQTDAFLVRMRRSNEPFLTPDGARSNERPIPYLFGRGSLLAVAAKGGGITVRATAIAEARRAMAIGKRPESPAEVDALEIPGALPFVLNVSAWQTTPLNVEVSQMDASSLTVNDVADQGIVLDATTSDSGLGISLSFGQSFPNELAGPTFVSDVLAATAIRHDPTTATDRNFGFVGLYLEDQGRWIAGFGAAYVESSTNGFRLVPLVDHIGTGNAQAVPSRPIEAPSGIVPQLFTARDGIEPALLCPALVR